MANEDLANHVRYIAETISGGFEGMKNEDGEEMTALDYIAEEALDLVYHVGSDGQFRGGEILVAFGGPNIWIDVGDRVVRGAWWGAQYSESYADTPGMYEALEDLHELTRI